MNSDSDQEKIICGVVLIIVDFVLVGPACVRLTLKKIFVPNSTREGFQYLEDTFFQD